MKVVLIGASGTIGSKVRASLEAQKHQVIAVGRKSGDYQANIEDRKSLAGLYQRIGSFDAVVSASGDVAFAPLSELGAEQWDKSLRSKLMGQIQLVQEAIPYINPNGSFTLVSGILSEDPIYAGVAASTVNRALEGFVISAACELPKGLRINLISPNVLKESFEELGSYFPGFIPVEGRKVAEAYVRSVLGIQTGKIYKVYE